MPLEVTTLQRAMSPRIALPTLAQSAGYRRVTASPVGNLLPRFIGEWIIDETGKDLYIAVGLEASDWRAVDSEGAGDFGTYGPALPEVAGLTWAWDFDMAYEPLGPMRAEIQTRAGSDSMAFMHPMSADLAVVSVSGTRRALRLDQAKACFARILDGLTTFQENNADFTMVMVGTKRSAGTDETYFHLFGGWPAGQENETPNNIRLHATTANAIEFFRNSASGGTSAGLGTLTTGAMHFVGRANLGGDNIARGLMNDGSKASSSARNLVFSGSFTQWAEFLVGGRGFWNSGSSGYPTYVKFADFDLERIALAAGAADDTKLDTLKAWALAGYP